MAANVECLHTPPTQGRALEIGGPDVISYGKLMQVMAEELQLRPRLIVGVPVLTPRLSSAWISLVTPVTYRIARPLADGLRNRVVVNDDTAQQLMPHEALSVQEAIRQAISTTQTGQIQTRWSAAGPIPGDPDWAGGKVFIDQRSIEIAAGPEAVFSAVCRVGGGLAGLCCARRLEQQGARYLILEKSDGAGGRIRTDSVEGFQLDRGFQVFLTSYPEARRVLDYNALELKPFLPGALVRYRGRFYQLTDPWRRPFTALNSIFSPVGSLFDKLRVARIRSRSMSGTIDDRFRDPETTTLQSLQKAGFSSAMIERFFCSAAPPIEQPMLVLNGQNSGPINNLCVLTNAAPSYGPRDESLVSVTVLRVPDDELRLREEVRAQLADWFGAAVQDWRHLRTYRIRYALPRQWPPALAEPERPVRWQPNLYVCGDRRDNASIQGAMVSGRRAAEAVMEDLA